MAGADAYLSVTSSGEFIRTSYAFPSRANGLKVAAPGPNSVHYSGKTSGATALASRTCHLIHDALEEAYGNLFIKLSNSEKALLLKALLVHTATWPKESASVIKSVLGPSDNKQHVKQKDNIRRFLGFGIGDPEKALSCANDRATFWASGRLAKERGVLVNVPIPSCVNTKALPKVLVATLAWFTPVAHGRQSYRTVRLKLELLDGKEKLRVDSSGLHQPDVNQASKGTVFSQRWEGHRAIAASSDQFITFRIQREPDQQSISDEEVPFGIAITFSMPGVLEIYDEVRNIVETTIQQKVR